MANTVISLKKSATPSSVPSNLANGELAINYADGKLYYKAANGTIAAISGNEPNYFGTVNANGTFVVADTPGDVLTVVSGNNISIVGDAVDDKFTVSLTNDVSISGKLNVQSDFAHKGGIFFIDNGAGAGGSSEGGEIQLANATQNQVLSGRISIDIYENKLRFFETNSPNRGAFINLAATATGVGTDLLSSSGATDTTARNWASAAFDKANAAFITANAAFANANIVMISAQSAFTVANSGFLHANAVYAFANAAYAFANSAHDIANQAFNKANSVMAISEVAPSSPAANTLWWNSETGSLYVYYNDGSSSQWVQVGGGGTGSGSTGTPLSRTPLYCNTSSLLDGTSENLNVATFKTFTLMKIVTTQSAWVRLYSDGDSRTQDESRAINTDPSAGTGLLAEFVTTANTVQKVTPFLYCGNLEDIPTSNIYVRVTNLSGTTATINIGMTIMGLES